MKQTVFKLPLIIGVAGGTSSEKTEIVARIIEKLDANAKKRDRPVRIVHLEMHSFYKELSAKDKELASNGKYNFDHPDAIDFEMCANTLTQMKEGKSVQIAKYDMKTSSVIGYDTIEPAEVILIEGILLLYDEKVRKCLGAKLFIERNAESRLRTRLEKYVKQYQRSPISAIEQYTDVVKPAFEEFCRPTKKYADVIIPRGADNTVAIALIAENLQEMFRKMIVSSARDQNGDDAENDDSDDLSSQGSFRRPASRPH